MADQLASPSDLASLLQQDLDASTATLLVEVGTAVVQAAAGQQRIVQVTDTATVIGTTDSWLDLPQIPVTAVSSVTIDGVAQTLGVPGSGGSTYRVHGNRLWRGDGWQIYCGEPSKVVVGCTHGYAAGLQELQLGRGAVLSIIKGAYAAPSGATRISIDDYTEAYEALSAQMDASPSLKAALHKQYGRRGGLARIG